MGGQLEQGTILGIVLLGGYLSYRMLLVAAPLDVHIVQLGFGRFPLPFRPLVDHFTGRRHHTSTHQFLRERQRVVLSYRVLA